MPLSQHSHHGESLALAKTDMATKNKSWPSTQDCSRYHMQGGGSLSTRSGAVCHYINKIAENTHASIVRDAPYFFLLDFIRTERLRWPFCMSVSSSPFSTQIPLWSTSTAASCTFSQPWKRPR